METAGAPGQVPGRTQAFTLPGLPAGLSFSMSPLAGLAHSSGGGASGSGGGLSRLPSSEEVQASMQREHSTERHMGCISLASSLDIIQQCAPPVFHLSPKLSKPVKHQITALACKVLHLSFKH